MKLITISGNLDVLVMSAKLLNFLLQITIFYINITFFS